MVVLLSGMILCEVFFVGVCEGFWCDVSLGGMVVICAFGINVVCYGMMKDNVLVLEVVMVDG